MVPDSGNPVTGGIGNLNPIVGGLMDDWFMSRSLGNRMPIVGHHSGKVFGSDIVWLSDEEV